MTISRRSIPEVHLPGLGARVPAEQWTREADDREGFREALNEASEARTGDIRADSEGSGRGGSLIQLRGSEDRASHDEAEAALAAAMLLSGGGPAEAPAKTLQLLRKATALGRQRLGALRAARAARGQANNLGAAIERLKAASPAKRAEGTTKGGARLSTSASPAEAALGRMLAAVSKPASGAGPSGGAEPTAELRTERPAAETGAPDTGAATARKAEGGPRTREQRARLQNPGVARRQPEARARGSRTRVSGRAADASPLSPKVMRAIMAATARPEASADGLWAGLASVVRPGRTQPEGARRAGKSARDPKTPASAEDAAGETTMQVEGGAAGRPTAPNRPEVMASAKATAVSGPAAAAETAQVTVDRVLSQLDMAVLRAGRVRQSLDLALGDLGRVRVDLDLTGGQLKVALVAADADAHKVLDRSVAGLVGGLVRRGYTEPVVVVKTLAAGEDSGDGDSRAGQGPDGDDPNGARDEVKTRDENDARLAAIRRWTRDRQDGEGER